MSDYKNYTFIEILKKSGEIKTVPTVLAESCIQKNNIDDIIKRLEFLENKNEKLIQKNNYLAKKTDRLTKRLPVDNDSLDNELIEDFIVF
jgi:hypothetical protein